MSELQKLADDCFLKSDGNLESAISEFFSIMIADKRLHKRLQAEVAMMEIQDEFETRDFLKRAGRTF